MQLWWVTNLSLSLSLLEIVCPLKGIELDNGNVTCSDGNRFSSECVFVCDPGYEMVYDITQTETLEKVIRRCLVTKTWSGRLPECRRKKCSANDGAIAKVEFLIGLHPWSLLKRPSNDITNANTICTFAYHVCWCVRKMHKQPWKAFKVLNDPSVLSLFCQHLSGKLCVPF